MTVHTVHYSLEEANALLPRLERLLEALREARDRLTDEEAREALAGAAAGNGGGQPGRQVGEAFLEVRGMVAKLQQAEIVLRDLDRGLVDFPSLRDGREVYLCWEAGEESIAHWHDLDTGFTGRQTL